MPYMGLMMHPEEKKLWVDALLSADYQQAQGGLKVDMDDGKVGYCCLGVYAEAKQINNQKEKWGKKHNFTFPNGKTDMSFLPDEWMMEFFEWNPSKVTSKFKKEIVSKEDAIKKLQSRLADMNDGDASGRFGFKSIGNWINRNL